MGCLRRCGCGGAAPMKFARHGRGRGHGGAATWRGRGGAAARRGRDCGCKQERAAAVARRLGETASTAAADEKERWIEIQPYG
jgi:hypothetical protein